MVEELRRNKELASAAGALMGSALGYQIGFQKNPNSPIVPMLVGGFVGKLAIELLLK